MQAPVNLTIPAQLSKTLDTKKCKAGDVFEMRTLEPVLIGKGVVMPENAKLHGRVLGARSREDGRPSWVVLLIENAEWKKGSLPLHAFVMAQITVPIRLAPSSGFDASSRQGQNVRPPRLQRGSPQSNPRDDIAKAISRSSPDLSSGNDIVQQSHPVEDVRVLQDKHGTVFLVSQKSHLKLPSGTMLMLRQQTNPADATPAGSSSSTQ